MANWVNYKTLEYTGYLDGDTKCSGFIKLYLQVDEDSATPTSVKIRFKIDNDNKNWKKDEYFIFWRPNQEGLEQFFRVKEGGASWPDYSKELTLSKTYTDTTFTIGNYWLCHTGSICNGETVFDKKDGYLYMTYGDAKTQKIYWYFTNNRKNFKTSIGGGFSISVPNSVATAVTATKPTITNYKNSSFAISAPAGTAGTNNTIKAKKLQWKFSGESSWRESTNAVTAQPLSYYGVANSTTSKTVQARTFIDGTYNDATSGTAEAVIENYKGPGHPGTPVISWTKTRMTNREPWTISWTAATRTNSNSNVAGYRIYLYKNGTNIHILDDKGTARTIQDSYGNIIWDTNSATMLSFTIDPKKHGFVAGDTVQVKIFAYATSTAPDGKSTYKFFSGGGTTSVASAIYTVNNAGIMRVKTKSSGWKEGQVYVKTANNGWQEAQAVYVKTKNSGWQEAQ